MSEEFDEKKLDSPLVVHKVTDASYQDSLNSDDINFAHKESDDIATLERHRYRKVKKVKKWPYVLIACCVAIVIIVTLYFSGVFHANNNDDTSSGNTNNYVQNEVNEYEGIITVKNTYVFFEGEEVDGVNGLVQKIKYIDEGTNFVVQNEKADSMFFNDEILPALDSYGIKYEVQTVVSSGLTSKYESKNSAPTESASSEE